MKKSKPIKSVQKLKPNPRTKAKEPINWVRANSRLGSGNKRASIDPFEISHELHPPVACPPKDSQFAFDNSLTNVSSWAAAVFRASFSEGVQFLGYPYLAELAQRPEYRVISQTIAEEMTRKWLKFEVAGKNKQLDRDLKPSTEPVKGQFGIGELPDEEAMESQEERQREIEAEAAEKAANTKADRINQLEKMFNDLNVKECCKTIVEQDGFFGRSHLYLDTGDTDNRDELRHTIGNGNDAISKLKISPDKPLLRIKPVEAVWCYPTRYESVDPLKPSWYKPEYWYVMSREVHISRLFTIVGNEVPDLLKPAYSFGGVSLSQMAQPYVNNWLQTRQSVNDLIQSFVVWGLKTNLSETLAMQGEQLFARLDLFNRLRNNRGVMAIDKETEEFFNVTAPLSGLESLQAQSQEHMAAVSRIPIVKLLGIQPAGLNASSDGEIRVFYDTIQGRQQSILTKPVTSLMHFCMLSLWGEIDNEISISWNPLWALDEKQKAEVRETNARTAQIHIDTGVIDKMEERRRVAEDPDTPYPGLDPNSEPDLKQEEEEGLLPKGAGGGLKAILGQEEEQNPEEPTDEEQNPEEPAEEELIQREAAE